MPPVHLVVNPAADRGRAATAAAAIAHAISATGREVVPVTAPDVDALRHAVAAVVADGAEHLVLAGGDGLVHHLLPALAQQPIDVGIVAVGSGNDFARGLGLPRRLDAAVAAALGPGRPVDLIRWGDRWAASVVTAGFSGAVNARANTVRWPPGRHRYTAATLRELPRLRPFGLVLRVDDQLVDGTCSLVAVANTAHFGGGMAICPDARSDDGLLDVTLVRGVHPATLALVFPLVFAGRHVRHPAVTTLRGATVELAAGDVALWADGEPAGALPARLSCVPGALRVAGALG